MQPQKMWTRTTGVSAPTFSSKAPPGDVRPGHIMLAPARTNFIAPRSTCNFFIIFGSVPSSRQEHIRGFELSVKWVRQEHIRGCDF